MTATPRTRLATTTAAVAAAVVLGACGGAGLGGGTPQPPFATVTIENDNTRTITVYAARPGGARMRLGTLPALTTRTFDLHSSAVGPTGEMRVLVSPLGTDRLYTSAPIYVERGDALELTVSHMIQ